MQLGHDLSISRRRRGIDVLSEDLEIFASRERAALYLFGFFIMDSLEAAVGAASGAGLALLLEGDVTRCVARVDGFAVPGRRVIFGGY